MIIIKKDNTEQKFDISKVVKAVSKSAERCMYTFTPEEIRKIKNLVTSMAVEYAHNHDGKIPISAMHNFAEKALDTIDEKIAKSYRDYRNYKVDFCDMLDSIYRKSQSIRYIGDISNANTDSAMISTQRSLIYGQLNKNLYQKFFLNKEELQAANEGFIYIHDMKDRLDSINCCLVNISNILKDGFEMGNQWYNEPKSLDVAFDVISDVTVSAASQQYGGFTLPRIDSVLAPYAEKSYKIYYNEYLDIVTQTMDIADDIVISKDSIDIMANKYAENKVRRDFEQGFQSWEYIFNTVGSSRGDYPFIAISFGVDTSRWGIMATEVCLEVRKKGQGKKGFEKTVLFPKLNFLYDKELHGKGKPYEYLYDKAIECSSKAMYPDFLSLTGEGYIPSIYKKYGKVISLMGCRASLSPWFERGGIEPADENDTPIFLDYYLELIRKLHKKTYAYLSEKKASTNPLMFMQGGLLGGNLKANDKIESILPAMTMSFGITALNELNRLYNGKSIYEDGEFPLEVMKYINEKINEFKKEDKILYAIYGTPKTLGGVKVILRIIILVKRANVISW